MVLTSLPGLLDRMADGPAAEPPPGITPDSHNPPNGNQIAVAVISIATSVAVISVLLRFCAKVFCPGKIKLEDYLGLVSFPFFLAGTSELIRIYLKAGFLVHMWNLQFGALERFIYSYVISTTLYCVSLLLAKTAILLELTHIFVASRNRFYWICYVMIVVNISLYIATIVTITFACNPRERLWKPYIPGTCINLNVFNIFITSFHLLSNLLMLLLPQTVIWKLALTKRQKVGLSVVFSAGALACVWAAGRLMSAIEISETKDVSYAYSKYSIWGLAEAATAELVFCVPAFPLAFKVSSPPRRLYEFLRSETKSIVSRSFSVISKQSQPPGICPRATPQSRYTSLESDISGAAIAELEMVKIRSDRTFDPTSENAGQILVTTHIHTRYTLRDDALQVMQGESRGESAPSK